MVRKPRLMRSSGLELRMEHLLRIRGIEFHREKTLPGLRFRGSLRCDFYIPKGIISPTRAAIIEIDGPHHFSDCPRQRARDLLKNMYAIHHGLHFLRIDYSCNRQMFDKALDTFLTDVNGAFPNIIKHNFVGEFYPSIF